MQSFPPDPDSLDSAWDADGGEEDRESTRRVDSRELFARAGFKLEEEPGEAQPADQGGFGRRGADGKITLPPPVPENEYLARMMEVRTSSSQDIPSVPRSTIPWESPRVAEDFAGTLGVLLEEQVGFDCDEPGVISSPSQGLDFGAPSIQAAEISVDDLSEDFSIDPPPPVRGRLITLDDIDLSEPSPTPHAQRFTMEATEPPAWKKTEKDVGFDFRLDLGFDGPELAAEESPATPPPGTLRYGLIEEDVEELGVVGATSPQAGPASLVEPTNPLRRERPHTLPCPPLLGDDQHLAEPPSSAGGRHDKLRLRFEVGDYSGALVLAEALLDEDADDEIARRYADSCNETLRQMYKARIGAGSQVLRVMISREELRSLNLDHRAGFLLSCIDGYSSIDEILDVSGMQELEALRLLFELVQADVIRCIPAP